NAGMCGGAAGLAEAFFGGGAVAYRRRVSDWEQIRAAHTVLEDSAILVLNKPAGITVTGERQGTDLVRLAAGAGQRLFPVHRIDKVTSGAIAFAKELRWHGGLTPPFAPGSAGQHQPAPTPSRRPPPPRPPSPPPS